MMNLTDGRSTPMDVTSECLVHPSILSMITFFDNPFLFNFAQNALQPYSSMVAQRSYQSPNPQVLMVPGSTALQDLDDGLYVSILSSSFEPRANESMRACVRSPLDWIQTCSRNVGRTALFFYFAFYFSLLHWLSFHQSNHILLDGIAASITISLINYVLLGFQFPVDGFFMHSFEVFLATTVVFWGSGTLGYTLLEYRLGHKKLVSRAACGAGGVRSPAPFFKKLFFPPIRYMRGELMSISLFSSIHCLRTLCGYHSCAYLSNYSALFTCLSLPQMTLFPLFLLTVSFSSEAYLSQSLKRSQPTCFHTTSNGQPRLKKFKGRISSRRSRRLREGSGSLCQRLLL